MDIISFNEASTANGRIESFIENPDSTSGIVTIPSTIASGETITIPAGRTAILPDIQIDGTLNVQGKVFIPSGSTLSTVVEKVASTDNAIVRFNGTTGDVQNSGVIIDDSGNVGIGATPSAWNPAIKGIQVGYGGSLNSPSPTETILGTNYYRNLFDINTYINNGRASKYNQSAGSHIWQIAPPGTAGNAIAWTNAMLLDASGILLQGTSTSVTGAKHQYSDGTIRMVDGYLIAGGAYTGTQTNHQLGFLTNDAERMRISSSGNLLVGTTIDNGVDKLQVNGSISSGTIKQYTSGDLNNFKYITETVGTYPSPYMSNIPINDHGYLEIIVYEGNAYVMQRFTTLGALQTAGRVFVRCLSNNTWSAWAEK